MGGGWPTACLVLAVLLAAVRGEEERWSRPATPERRQGDWVPLSCANCRLLADQNVQASNSLPSVLTPPPRSEGARLLPPPPPDGLFLQAATGFPQSFMQQQPPRKHQQFLQETTAQSINRPQAQFLKAANPKIPQQFLREPSQDFQPPQDPFQNRQPQLLHYNQQFQDQQYLNQPLLLGPQFLAAPFFPQTSIPPQNVQPISPVQLQPQQPLAPNVVPVNNQNFQVSPDRPLFTQQITAGQEVSGVQQQGVGQATQQFSSNETEAQRDEGEKEEVQLLYVPVETLKQRARGKPKAFPSNQQDVSAQQVQQALGSENNRFTTPQQQIFEQSTIKSSVEDQINFNTQTAKPQYNTKQNTLFQQQLPPEDQEKFNTQTHSVRQQFTNQNLQLQQQPEFGNTDNLKFDAQNTREQFNFKSNDKIQPEFGAFNQQFNFQPSSQFQQQTSFESLGNLPVPTHNVREEQDQENFNRQTFNANQQFRHQQQLPPLEQLSFSNPGLVNSQQQFHQNNQFNEQLNQQAFSNFREQPYINQPIRLDQPLVPQQGQFQQKTTQYQPQQFNLPELQQQTTRQQSQQFNLPEIQQQTTSQQTQQFSLPEVQQETVSPVSQTVQPTTFASEETTRQRFREPQQDLRRPQQVQNNQFLRKFPQDYQQSTTVPTSPSPTIDTTVQVQDLRHSTDNLFHQHRNLNQQYNENSSPNLHKPLHQQSTLSPEFSTTPQPKTTPAPNQPPLSVYMETTEESKVNDVLRLLKNAKSIQVLDTVGPESPQVFVGPSNLKAPSGYIKFELPYLNSLDNNRVERKVDKLPFFVAPLNFNPPPGYSKIPFPAPHIGSVVVSNVTVLRTALHEKPYENEPSPISSTEQYHNQFTFPEAISPISPQLPSLINSLRDEIYSGSSTPSFPSTTTETTTEAYTTQAYRGRGSSRASQRGSSNYIPSTSATRKPQPRTRRPYSRRQPVTTTTTTEEPTSEVTLQQNITPQSDQLEYNSESFSVQSVVPPSTGNSDTRQPTLQSGNIGTYYNEQFVANNLHQNQFAPQHVTHPTENQINQQYPQTDISQDFGQTQQFSQQSQNTYSVDSIPQTTTVPTVASSVDQLENQELKNQRANNGFRRDPARPLQRFRGRQRTTTTTTEVYEQPPPQPIQDQYQPQVVSTVNDNTPHGHHLQGTHRLVENTHFTASVPQNSYNPQTERADVNFQTTERFTSAQNEDYNIQENAQRGNFNTYLNTDSRQQLFQQPSFSHSSESNQPASQYNLQQPRKQFSQPQQEQSTQQFQQHLQVENSHPTNSQGSQIQHFNQDQIRFDPHQGQHNYFDQQRQHDVGIQNQQFVNDQQSQQIFDGQQVKDVSNQDLGHQGHHLSTPGHLEQITEITASIPQETYAQTTESVASQSQEEQEAQVQQYNQQRLLKYNRPASRTPVAVDTTSTEAFRRDPQHLQANSESPDVINTDDVTTKAPLVRVRGRVRSRQRGTVRQSTTTEEPNYPSGYLTRQRNNQDDGSHDYSTKKRVNYSPRQSYTSLRNNKDVRNEQSEAYSTTEKPASLSTFTDYTDESTSTTTEALSDKPARKYQHILNRNKLRRVRPTSSPSTSGSSGTTRFLHPTTPPPVTRLPSSTRGRIRKPVSLKPTTTEYPPQDSSWNERENFAPSAGSNEILEPLYQTKEKAQPSFNFQRNHAAQNVQPKTSPRPPVQSDGDDYWNQGVTIHQSTSYDFQPDSSSVTPSSFKVNDDQAQGTPVWDGQIELQDGKYYNVFNQKPMAKNSDQTPFSTDQQRVVYKEIKGRRPTGKENQYTDKEYELKKHTSIEEESVSQVYPVYRETSRSTEKTEDEEFQNGRDQYTNNKKTFNGKAVEEHFERHTQRTNEEAVDAEAEGEIKEGALKRKIIATNSGKKGLRRRGNWVRVRVRKPQDMFEAAESQNLASLSENAIQGVTKTTTDRLAWTPEPITEASITSTEETSEPGKAITFEEALKDMLKEFITNPEEDVQGEVDTESNTDWPSPTFATNTTEEVKETEKNSESESSEKEVDVSETAENTEAIKSKSTSDDIIVKTSKEDAPEVTTEVFTQEPTTVFQLFPESSETTIEPDVTTIPDEVTKTQNSRILGTSTTTEISLETEICYRGRCVKTKKEDTDSDLLTME